MVEKNILIDGFAFEHIVYNNRHYLFSKDEDISVIAFDKSYEQAKLKARETIEHFFEMNRKRA